MFHFELIKAFGALSPLSILHFSGSTRKLRKAKRNDGSSVAVLSVRCCCGLLRLERPGRLARFFSFLTSLSYPPPLSIILDAPESETVGLFIALKHRNLGAFNDAFEKASNPDSKEFRKWLTNDAVLSMISPPAKDSQSVVDWVSSTCKSGSVQTLDNRRDTIRVEATVACVKQLFPSIRLATYTHRVRSAQVVRLHTESISASVPAHLSHIVDLGNQTLLYL